MGEDLGEWDDSSSLVPDIGAKAVIIAKEECIISGLAEAAGNFCIFRSFSHASLR